MYTRIAHRGEPRRALAPTWLARGTLTFGLVGVLIVSASQPAASTARARLGAPRGSGPFAWLMTTAAPADWPRAALPSGRAQLSYPPSFAPLAGDPGTVSFAVRDATGVVLAYINVTPRQGSEALRGFGAFRVRLLRDEDETVREDAAAEGLAFPGGRGSCVIDQYVTRIGRHDYRELACLVEGRHGGAVVVAAATVADWKQFEPLLREAVASFTVQ